MMSVFRKANKLINKSNNRTVRAPFTEPLEPRMLLAADPAFVNTRPSFTLVGNVNAPQDAPPQAHPNWATNISPGPASDAGQTVSFIVAADQPSLFSVQPAIAPDGTLTFTPALGAHGDTIVSVIAQDNGGTANGGFDTSLPQILTINIKPSMDPPVFTKGADQVVNENAPAQTVKRFARNISIPNNDDPDDSTVVFILLNDNNALFSDQPAISSDGTLTYTPAPFASGVAHVSVWAQTRVAHDPTDLDTSPVQTFAITVNFVNQPPTFTVGTTQIITPSAGGPQTIPNFITNTSPGAPNESTQSVVFQVTNDNPSLFTVQPALSPDGTLTYTPATGVQGIATLTIVATDSLGGTTTQTAVIGVNVPTLADAYEDNDTRAITDARTPGVLNSSNFGKLTKKKIVIRNLNTLDDATDWYRFTLGAAATKSNFAMITFNSAQAPLTLTLLPAKGKIRNPVTRKNVRSVPATAGADRQTVSLSGLRAGTYYLRVDGASSPNYTLTITAPVKRAPKKRTAAAVLAAPKSVPAPLFSRTPISAFLSDAPSPLA